MKHFMICLLCVALIGIVGLTQRPVWAKGAPAKVILTGPGIQGEVEITEPEILQDLSWAALGFVHGGVSAPSAAGPYYELLGYNQEENGKWLAWDRVRYFPQSNIVFYVGQEPDENYSEFDGMWFHPKKEGELILRKLIARFARSPQIYGLNAWRAKEVATLAAFMEYYNTGRQQALEILTADVTWIDCDYSREKVVELKGKAQVADWIKQRYTDHDQLQLDSIQINDADKAAGDTISAAFLLRTSDTLKAKGKPNGLTPLVAATITFSADAQQIRWFVNGPRGGPADSCRIFRL